MNYLKISLVIFALLMCTLGGFVAAKVGMVASPVNMVTAKKDIVKTAAVTQNKDVNDGDTQAAQQESAINTSSAPNEEPMDFVSEDKLNLTELGIVVGKAGPGHILTKVAVTGDVKMNADRVAHLAPRVPGVVCEVHNQLGDRVQSGDVLAVLESRELADAKAEYLAAKDKLALAQTTFQREESLWKKRISPEEDYLNAKQAMNEADLNLRTARQKLRALGLSTSEIQQIANDSETTFTRYELKAPFAGTIIEKCVTLGSILKDDVVAFSIADLSTVWVDLSIQQKDLPLIRSGQEIVVSAGHGIPDARGTISYIGPALGQETRTALARVIIPNKNEVLKPGAFVTGKITVGNQNMPVLAPRTAIQTVDNQSCVFTRMAGGFKLESVTLGQCDDTNVEIASGLKPGQEYVTAGGFSLKAQLSKGAFGGDSD